MTKKSAAVPANYDGREQAWIKHQLLASYLEKLLLIIGMAARAQGKVEICYVDCFAGPWGDDSEQMEGTSIAISMRIMAQCKQKLAKLGVEVTMRALYIELDGRAFVRLSDYLQKATPAGVETRCMKGDFIALRQDILSWCGDTAFAFFFIDPKGWKTVGVPNLRTLLGGSSRNGTNRTLRHSSPKPVPCRRGEARFALQRRNQRTRNISLACMAGAHELGQHDLHARQVGQLGAHVLELVLGQAAGFLAMSSIIQAQ